MHQLQDNVTLTLTIQPDTATEVTTPVEFYDAYAYPLEVRVILGGVLLMENVAGLLCNVLVLVVYHLSQKGTIANTDSKTTINNVYLTNLNVVDIFTCLSAVPFTLILVVTTRYHNLLFCLFHEATISFASSASAINLLVISFDRYETIVKPFRQTINNHNVKYVICAIWVLTVVGFGSPFLALISSHILSSSFSSNLYPCFKWVEPESNHRVYYEVYYVGWYIIANTVMIICYWRIFQAASNRFNIRQALVTALVSHMPNLAKQPHVRLANSVKQHKTMTKMTLMIVVTFMICWAPHTVTSIIIMAIGTTYELEIIQLCCLALAYLSTVLHPLLYAFMRHNFRAAFTNRVLWRNPTKVVPHVVLPSSSSKKPTA